MGEEEQEEEVKKSAEVKVRTQVLLAFSASEASLYLSFDVLASVVYFDETRFGSEEHNAVIV